MPDEWSSSLFYTEINRVPPSSGNLVHTVVFTLDLFSPGIVQHVDNFLQSIIEASREMFLAKNPSTCSKT